MINRVTQQTVQRTTLANVQLNLAKMSDLQARMSSGKLITKPSDDPAGTATAMSLRSQVRAAEQFSRNADDGVGWLSTVDFALNASVTDLRKARDLTVQGGNGSLNAAGREAIARQLEGVRDGLLAQANATYLGRSVFAGTSDAGVAFTDGAAVPPYEWTGTAGATVDRRLATDTTVRADADGAVVFGTGAGSVFARQLEGVRDGLLAQANATYLGRSVFAGTSDAGVAFTDGAAVPPYAWTGTAGATVDRRLATDTTVRADADGATVFGTGAGSVFALIDSIAADLRAGVNVGPRLTEIDTRMDTMLGELSGAGTRYNQMTAAQDLTAKAVMDLTSQLGRVEDIDLAATILDLESQEVAYKGALGAAARVLQPTLMDFLR